MAPPLTLEQLATKIAILLAIVQEQNAGLCAVIAYLRAQPSYDADLMARLHDQEVDRLGLPMGDSAARLASLRRQLEALQGTHQ